MKPIPKIAIFAAVTGVMWLMYWVAVGRHSTWIDNEVEKSLPLSLQLVETTLCAVSVGGLSTFTWWLIERRSK